MRARPKLTVVTDALVHRMLFKNCRATGVVSSSDGRTSSAGCRKEIVATAGAIGSPQLLLLSGIGPVSHLADLGTAQMAELPEGRTQPARPPGQRNRLPVRAARCPTALPTKPRFSGSSARGHRP
ncbi:hypothetical protein BJY18_007154 [Amycolatopsis jiangsuensis]|uniref:Glucose-methanol-choline oxidoreductase N-terminal domain-containing protein n=1 Tax=Amycolatopsis jiangsuensis TaxID=1181879 RepID=A0A840J7I0_9PSEU|nr:hypothetical protein [Amycolatopsis jiangsuensis]